MSKQSNYKEQIISALVPLLSVVLGGLITYFTTIHLYTQQKNFDDQRASYAKLYALKHSWPQSIQSFVYAYNTAEFYDTRIKLFDYADIDIEEAKKSRENTVEMIKEISIEQKELFETLGVIQTCFEMDKELDEAIDDLYNVKAIRSNKFPLHFKSDDELRNYFNKVNNEKALEIEKECLNKIKRLISLLKTKLDD